MKMTSLCLAILATVVSASCTPRQQWLRISGVGEQDKPLTKIWISNTNLKIPHVPFSEFVVMPESQYNELIDVVHRTTCSSEKAKELQPFGALEVVQSTAEGEALVCFLGPDESCSFLNKINANDRVDRFSPTRPVRGLQVRLGCIAAEVHSGNR
jgi:hypothetical protein